MDEPVTSSSCYNGQDLAFAVIGTMLVWTVVLWLLFRLYQKHLRNRKESQLEDPENAKQEFAFDNTAMEGDSKADSEPASKQNSNIEKKLELANNNVPQGNMSGSDYTADGLEIGAGANGGVRVTKYNHAKSFINIGDIITSITIDCKDISEEHANAILRYAAPYSVHFGLKAVSDDMSPTSDQSTTFQTDRETRLLENYPTLKIDDKLYNESNASTMTVQPNAKKVEERIVSLVGNNIPVSNKLDEFSVSKHNGDNHVLHVSKDKTILTQPKQPENINDSIKFTKISEISNVVEKNIVKPISNIIERNPIDFSYTLSNELKIDSSVPPPVNKRTKYLKRENSTEEILTEQYFLNRNSSLNSSGIARDEAGIPLELPNHMTESAKWTHANRKSITTSSVKPEPMVRAKVPIPPTVPLKSSNKQTEQELGFQSNGSEFGVDNNNTEIIHTTMETVKNYVNNGLSTASCLDETDSNMNYSQSSVKSELKNDTIDQVKNGNITIDSSLVEQVLAVADGFSNETKATLTRQLSELNDDISSSNENHVINFITTNNTAQETNNNNNVEVFQTKLKSGSYDPWNKQQIEQKSEKITINDTMLSDDIDNTIYPSSWTDQPSSITFESSKEVKTLILPEIDRSLGTTGENAVFSSDNLGVNSINITSIEIPAKLSLGNVVTLNPSQPSSIIIIESDALDHKGITLSEDNQFASRRVDSAKQDDDQQTFVTEIALQKQSSTNEKLPPHAPARVVNASAKTTSESSETRTFVAHRPPLERGKSHSEIPVLVRKTSIPTLPSLSTISPVLSTSSSSLTRSSPSKIPVFNTKSISPDREFSSSLIGKPNGNGAMSRSHSTLSARSSNPGPTLISVTSIKNSSRNPSGK